MCSHMHGRAATCADAASDATSADAANACTDAGGHVQL